MSEVCEIGLLRDMAAPGAARRSLGAFFGTELEEDVLTTAKLLTSELVTNAVRHGTGKITLRARLDTERLLVEVEDEGSGFEWILRKLDLDDLGGWGLNIVQAEASRWGAYEGTTHVWFELRRA